MSAFLDITNSISTISSSNTNNGTKIQSGMDADMKLLNYFLDAAAEAEQAVQQNQTEANNIDQSFQNQNEKNLASIQPILDAIQANKDTIAEILSQVQDLENDKKDINDNVKLSQIEIEKNKKKFVEGDADAKKEALAAISAEAENIRGYLADAEALSTTQADLDAAATDLGDDNAGLSQQADTVTQEGEDALAALQVKSAQNKADTVALEAQVPVHEAKGAALEAEAVALESGGSLLGGASALTNLEASQLRQQAESEFRAGSVIGSGVPNIFNMIIGSAQTSDNSLAFITNSFSTIGSMITDSDGQLSGFFDSSSALGFDGVVDGLTAGSEGLDVALNEGEAVVDNMDSEDGENGESDNNSKKVKFNFETDELSDIA